MCQKNQNFHSDICNKEILVYVSKQKYGKIFAVALIVTEKISNNSDVEEGDKYLQNEIVYSHKINYSYIHQYGWTWQFNF